MRRRVYLKTLREIQPGEELVYDYEIPNEGETEETALTKYPCHCGADNCRGTLLLPPVNPSRKAKRSVRKQSPKRSPVTRGARSRQKRQARSPSRRRSHARST